MLSRERAKDLFNKYKEELSLMSLTTTSNTLRTAMRQAVVWGLFPADPTTGLRVPRAPKQERKVLTKQELLQLLAAAGGYKHYLIIRLLALTGLRLGEALGLKWQDISFKDETLTVRRAADSRHRILKETKTSSSERTLKLDAETIALLKAQKKNRGKVRPLTRENDLIFVSPDGRPLKESSVRKTLNRALAKAGLPHIRVHDLRHTAASLLLDEGYSFPVVASFLGHSSPATTAAVYAHAVRKGGSLADILSRSDQNSDQARKYQ
jgi:integrase